MALSGSKWVLGGIRTSEGVDMNPRGSNGVQRSPHEFLRVQSVSKSLWNPTGVSYCSNGT